MTDYTLIDDKIGTGLELEYENIDSRDVRRLFEKKAKDPFDYWHVERDGSLRPQDRNVELKFAVPLSGKNVVRALKMLRLLDGKKYTHGWRCGMHVHIDYTNVAYLYAHNTYIIASLLEPLLFKHFGPARTESKFCGSASRLAYGSIRNGDKLNARKYSAVNLRSIVERNSVEFRYADCTKDRQVMVDFINVNIWLRQLGMKYDNAWDIVNGFLLEKNIVTWLKEHAHPRVYKILLKSAQEVSTSYPWAETAPAALALAEHQDTFRERIRPPNHDAGNNGFKVGNMAKLMPRKRGAPIFQKAPDGAPIFQKAPDLDGGFDRANVDEIKRANAAIAADVRRAQEVGRGAQEVGGAARMKHDARIQRALQEAQLEAAVRANAAKVNAAAAIAVDDLVVEDAEEHEAPVDPLKVQRDRWREWVRNAANDGFDEG